MYRELSPSQIDNDSDGVKKRVFETYCSAQANGDLQLAQQSATILLQEAQTNATVILQRAVNNAEAIRRQYQEQAEIAANITKTNGLSIDG